MSIPTIKASSDISYIFQNGIRAANRYVSFIYIDSNSYSEHDLSGRVAFIAGKRLGNSVWRNAAKRRMREIYRDGRHDLNGLDILFVAKPALLEDSYSKVLDICRNTLKKIKNTHTRNKL